MHKYKDRESYNQWLYYGKEYNVWAAEEVVRILKEFGAKLGKDLPAHKHSDLNNISLKRRRC